MRRARSRSRPGSSDLMHDCSSVMEITEEDLVVINVKRGHRRVRHRPLRFPSYSSSSSAHRRFSARSRR
jgi:hypothetical protein